MDVMLALLAATTLLASPSLRPGVYKTTVRAPAALKGTWRLAFNGPNFGITRNGVLAAAGTATVSGNRVTIRDLAGPLACRRPTAAGTYTWALRGSTLRFTRVDDQCAGRRAVLSRPFRKLG